ncbi:hypothetical protein [Chitinophaga sp.]|uniref:hypothetical protein n=1 Tax=Chitinophaga sp. TaxID=1869181 RepID=UPI0031D8904B
MRYITLFAILFCCSCSNGDKQLLHKKWRVYDVVVPPGSGFDIAQINQAAELKRGYYTDVYYQFLDNNLFIATNTNKPDSGKYKMLSNGKVISITANNGDRAYENLVTVVTLDDTHFDMKVKSGDYYFILKTKAE